jgi:RNA polymerase primary sigma factor
MTRPRRLRSDSVQSPLETYLREINETPLLSAEEEKQLAYRIEGGDSEARDRMVRANLRLVVNIARGYTGKGLGLQDLIEEGNLGLLRAVEGFDPSMNTRFSTYASYWIKQSIKRALVNTAKTIRIPAYVAELLAKWRRASAGLAEELGRAPAEEEVAARVGLSPRKVRTVRKALRVVASAAAGGEEVPTLNGLAGDERAGPPEARVSADEEAGRVRGLLDRLGGRKAAVLRMRFGLGDGGPKTLKEIGERLGLTRERIRQIEAEGLRQLRDSLGAA